LPAKADGADKARKTGVFRHMFPFDKVNKGERIVIYGAGRVGSQYAGQLAALDYCDIVAFADTYAEAGGTFEGRPCLTPEELMGQAEGFDRIVIASTIYHAQILDRLRALGIRPERIV
jgi:FlaA1/EpsC-like NDP-sugar epimerase